MFASPRSEFTVAEGQSVFCLNYSPAGDQFIASTADAKPVIYDKNGNKNAVFIKGNPYVLDNSKTPGHTNTVYAACWHPTDLNKTMTASLDGTCRIWDLNGKKSFNELESLQAIRAKNKRGLKVGITSACFNLNGNQIVLGCVEGGVEIFDTRNRWPLHRWMTRSFSRSILNNFTSHTQPIIDVHYHSSGQVFTTRGRDNVVCLWDSRNIAVGGGVAI